MIKIIVHRKLDDGSVLATPSELSIPCIPKIGDWFGFERQTFYEVVRVWFQVDGSSAKPHVSLKGPFN